MQRLAIVYYSQTKQTVRFIEKLIAELGELETIRIETGEEVCETPFLLVTPTYKFGKVPDRVADFFMNSEVNERNIKGVVSSGNKNWGSNFAKSGDIISEKFKIPLIHKYELRGNANDVNIVSEGYRRLTLAINNTEKDE